MGKKKKAERDNAPRAVRGGCWNFTTAYVRVACRDGSFSGNRLHYLSVRLVRRRSALERLVDGPWGVGDEQEEG